LGGLDFGAMTSFAIATPYNFNVKVQGMAGTVP